MGFLWPLGVLTRMSLNRTEEGGTLVSAFSSGTYAKLAADDFTWSMTADSLRLAAVAATAALLLALILAVQAALLRRVQA